MGFAFITFSLISLDWGENGSPHQRPGLTYHSLGTNGPASKLSIGYTHLSQAYQLKQPDSIHIFFIPKFYEFLKNLVFRV